MKDKRMEDRHLRLGRDRDLLAGPSPPRTAYADYSSRSEPLHRSSGSSSATVSALKGRTGDRYESAKGEAFG